MVPRVPFHLPEITIDSKGAWNGLSFDVDGRKIVLLYGGLFWPCVGIILPVFLKGRKPGLIKFYSLQKLNFKSIINWRK